MISGNPPPDTGEGVGNALELVGSREVVGASGAILSNHVTLALDSDDHPHIAYIDYITGNLRYVAWNGTSWVPPDRG